MCSANRCYYELDSETEWEEEEGEYVSSTKRQKRKEKGLRKVKYASGNAFDGLVGLEVEALNY